MGQSYISLQNKPQPKPQPQLKRTTCYNNHPLDCWKTYGPNLPINSAFCNQCSFKKNALLVCSQCNYKVCSTCNQVKHNDICQNEKMKFGSQNFCSYCEKERKDVLVCQTCNFHHCYACEPFYHSNICKEEKFRFSENESCVQACNFCGQSTESYMYCENCKMKICNKCRKQKSWK